MVRTSYIVNCLKLGIERYIKYRKIDATIKYSKSTVSIYVNGTSLPANARISDHHPTMDNYPKDNREPWHSDNISLDFVLPKSKEDKTIRARVQQNSSGTIKPFDVDIYQYNPQVLEVSDISNIFKAVILFLEGNGFTDPFKGTAKEALYKPRHSNIKPYKPKTTTKECTENTYTSPKYLEYASRLCLKEIYGEARCKPIITITESDLRHMVRESICRILSEQKKENDYTYKPIGSHKFWSNNGKTEWKSIVTLQTPYSKQCCHIVEDDHCYVLFNGSGLDDKNCKLINWIFPEAFEALKALPPLR